MMFLGSRLCSVNFRIARDPTVIGAKCRRGFQLPIFFVARYPERIVNVHHSFLPAFSGAKPYHAAYERDIKLIGATSHYMTEALNEGPIIEQDVVRGSHRDQLEGLIEKGRDMERIVLSLAVKWHLQNRILHYSRRAVIFD